MPRRPGAQHPQHAIHHLPRLAPRTAAIVRTPRLAEFDQRSDQVPLHIREVCHTSDVLEILPRCNCLFAGDIYEIASQYSEELERVARALMPASLFSTKSKS